MKFLKTFLALFLFCGAIMTGGSRANAATSSDVIPLPTRLVVVAETDVHKAVISKHNGNSITVDFDLENKNEAQPDIRYGVMLTQQKGSSTATIDTKVFPTVISLADNETKHVEFEYAAPDFLRGDYQLVLRVETGSGLSIGMIPLGPIALSGSGRYLDIDVNSCYLTVGTSSAKYTLDEGVDVLPSENLVAHCSVQNKFSVTVTTTPTFATYARTVFGAPVASTSLKSMSFLAGRAARVQFIIPKAQNPQAYDAVLALSDDQGRPVSNSAIFHYVIHGAGATIQHLVFDKDSYAQGDTAKLTLFWSGSSDNFMGSRLGGSNQGALSADVLIADGQGVPCAAPLSKALGTPLDGETLSIPITAQCMNPAAQVSIKDKNGTVLASSTLSIASKVREASNESPKAKIWMLVAVAVVAVVAIALVLFIIFKKRKGAAIPLNVIALLAVAGVSFAFALHAAPAHAYLMMMDGDVGPRGGGGGGNEGIASINFSIGLDKDQYTPGEQIVANGSWAYLLCTNGAQLQADKFSLTMTINGETKEVVGTSPKYGSNTFTAELQPGTYNAHYKVYGQWSTHSKTVEGDIPYTVVAPSANATLSLSTTSIGLVPDANVFTVTASNSGDSESMLRIDSCTTSDPWLKAACPLVGSGIKGGESAPITLTVDDSVVLNPFVKTAYAALAPGDHTAVLTVHASPGDFTSGVTNDTQTVTVTYTVPVMTPPGPPSPPTPPTSTPTSTVPTNCSEFQLQADTTTFPLALGSSRAVKLSLKNFAGSVTVSAHDASGAPLQMNPSTGFNLDSTTPATLTLTASPLTSTGDHNVTVTGVDGATSAFCNLSLSVNVASSTGGRIEIPPR